MHLLVEESGYSLDLLVRLDDAGTFQQLQQGGNFVLVEQIGVHGLLQGLEVFMVFEPAFVDPLFDHFVLVFGLLLEPFLDLVNVLAFDFLHFARPQSLHYQILSFGEPGVHERIVKVFFEFLLESG